VDVPASSRTGPLPQGMFGGADISVQCKYRWSQWAAIRLARYGFGSPQASRSGARRVGADLSAKTDCQAPGMGRMYRPFRGQVRSYRGCSAVRISRSNANTAGASGWQSDLPAKDSDHHKPLALAQNVWERTCPRRLLVRRQEWVECTGPFADRSAPTGDIRRCGYLGPTQILLKPVGGNPTCPLRIRVATSLSL